ncbi:HNH endonuclease [Arthrobacter sp. CJ23]|uniref:HNH endonuclease n=1 Tax=Arthrobacter sp. CJ23 TaxID=2972479 RepID=UPI0037BEAE78
MELVYATYEPVCHLCGKWIDVEATGNYGPSVDHLVARSHGGSDELSNLKPAHFLCNSTRQNRPIEEWRATNTNELEWLISLAP